MDSAADDFDLDLQLAWRTFSQADRQRRNMLSRDQVHAHSACMCMHVRVPDAFVDQSRRRRHLYAVAVVVPLDQSAVERVQDPAAGHAHEPDHRPL